jgi:tRNA(Ile)-lysidine synthase
VPGARSPGAARATSPLADVELSDIAGRWLTGYRSLVFAVSGGPDSMALMLLASRWRSASAPPPRIIVATVDHGLRPESAEEADWVREQAGRLGLAHETLRWEGPKPATGRQEAAREARYRLLEDLAARLPPPIAIVLAHHLDDQAETFLMRLARGSGVDGLSAMQPVRRLGTHGIAVVRPFLDVAPLRLRATLLERGLAWREDPSNADPAYERVRVRQAMKAAATLGLSHAAVALSARRLARARTALDHVTGALLEAVVDNHRGAYASLPVEAFDRAPEELRVRLLQRLTARFGGISPPPASARLEVLAERLSTVGEQVSSTLGGCQVRRMRDAIVVMREPGRRGLPVLELAPGTDAIWDGRFGVSARKDAPAGLIVAAASAADIAGLLAGREAANRPQPRETALARKARLTLPAFWHAGRIVAFPALGWSALAGLEAEFIAP